MKKILIKIMFSLLFVNFSCGQKSKIINQKTFDSLALKSNVIVFDVRTKEEIQTKKIQSSSLYVDYYSDDFQTKIQKLDKTKTYLIYCRSGVRSMKTLKLMSKFGFLNIYSLDGGIDNYKFKK